MSEIAALQAADRERALPAGLRAQAIATLMQIPDDVAVLAAAEEPRTLPLQAADSAFALLMGAETAPVSHPRPMVVAPVSEPAAGYRAEHPPAAEFGPTRSPRRRRPRPLAMRLLAAAMAAAIPAGGLIVATRLVDSGPKLGPSSAAPPVTGPVYERDEFERGRPEFHPPAVQPRQPSVVEPQTPRRSIVKTAVKGTRIQRNAPPRRQRPPSPPQNDVALVLSGVVSVATDLVCEVTGTVTAILAPGAGSTCPPAEKSQPLLGSSG